MSDANMESSKPPHKLHMVNIVAATLASMISIVGGIYSLKTNLFHHETTPSAVLAGVVRDERLAKPLRLATLEVQDSAGETVSTLSTDDDGKYEVKNLKEGSYRIEASAPLHESLERKVFLQKNSASTVDFSLTPLEERTPTPSVPDSSVPVPPARNYADLSRPTNLATAPAESYATDYPDNDSSNFPDEYGSQPRRRGAVASRQTSGTELLVKTGAALVQEFINAKREKQLQAESGTSSSTAQTG